MISRVHGRVQRVRTADGRREEWVILDEKSKNGILVNDKPIGSEGGGHVLHHGDVVTFGRRLFPPIFEFVFELALESPGKAMNHAGRDLASPDDVLLGGKLRRRIEQLLSDLERDRQNCTTVFATSRAPQRKASHDELSVAEIHSELACSICRDWLVDSATIECAHTFCWSCIDTWLLMKKFECPVCRVEVTREPVRTSAVDAIVQKAVDHLSPKERDEHAQRVAAASAASSARRELLGELEKRLSDELQLGIGDCATGVRRGIFHIGANWKKKQRDTFEGGIKNYTGEAREMYCRLFGLTVQWVHSADDSQLNQALHNLQLQQFVSCEEGHIRQRLLMFLRYG